MTRRSNHQRYFGLYRCVANRTACIWMTEIKQHVRVSQRDFITEIRPGHNLNAFAFGDANDRLPHSTRSADKCNTKFCHQRYGEPFKKRRFPTRRILQNGGLETAAPCYYSRSNSSRVLRKRAWFAALISQSGNRTSAEIVPRHDNAVFIGSGFGSINKSLNNQ